MGLLNFFSKQENPVLNGMDKVRRTADAISQAQDAFGSIGGNPAMTSMMGETFPTNRPSKSNSRRFYDNDEDDERDYGYQAPVVLDEQLMKNFRKKAEMQTDLLIGELEFAYLWKRLVAKLFITNIGDEDVAKQYRDYNEEEIGDLPKEVQLILRNQIHVKSIDKVTINEVLKESIIDYFVLDYETTYRSGIMPDFSHINPIALLKQQFNNPFYKLVADLTYDWGLKNKEEGKKLLINVFNRMKERFADSDAEAIETIERSAAQEQINAVEELEVIPAIAPDDELAQTDAEVENVAVQNTVSDDPDNQIIVINDSENDEEKQPDPNV